MHCNQIKLTALRNLKILRNGVCLNAFSGRGRVRTKYHFLAVSERSLQISLQLLFLLQPLFSQVLLSLPVVDKQEGLATTSIPPVGIVMDEGRGAVTKKSITPCPSLPVHDLLQHLQTLLRHAFQALQHHRHAVLYGGQLLKGGLIGRPVLHQAALHLCHLCVQRFQH